MLKGKNYNSINHYKVKTIMMHVMINAMNIKVMEVKIHQLRIRLKRLEHIWVI